MDWGVIYTLLEHDLNTSLAWESCRERVVRWARQDFRGIDAQLIDDAVADTLAMVFCNFGKARGSATFVAFVFDHYRNARRRWIRLKHLPSVPLTAIDLEHVQFGTLDEVADEPDATELKALQECLQLLPVRQRKAVWERLGEQRAAQEIGADLQLEANATRQLVFRGLASLRECVRARLAAVRTPPLSAMEGSDNPSG